MKGNRVLLFEPPFSSTAIATHVQQQRHPLAGALRRAETAHAIGIAAGIPFAVIGLVATLTPNDNHFCHAADYWYTGLGIPYLAAPDVIGAVPFFKLGLVLLGFWYVVVRGKCAPPLLTY